MHFHVDKSAYMSERLYLVRGIWSDIFEHMVLVHGIASKVTGSLVLVFHGFGPWFE